MRKLCRSFSRMLATNSTVCLLAFLVWQSSAQARLICISAQANPHPSTPERLQSSFQDLIQFAQNYGVHYNPEKRYVHQRGFGKNPFVKKESLLTDGFGIRFFGGSSKPAEESVQFETEIQPHSGRRRMIRTEPVLTNTLVDNPELHGEIWRTDQGKRFRWFNAGASLLVEDGNFQDFEDRAEAVARQHPGEALDIEVPFNPIFSKARQVILDRQIWASTRVTDHYAATKPYLDPGVLFGLRYYDSVVPSRNEYLMLLQDRGKSPLVMEAQEFQDSLLAVLRLAHLDYRSFEDNMVLLKARGLMNEMPHEGRVWLAMRSKMRGFFDQLSEQGKLNVTEITRFNRFGEVPREVMESLMLRALLTAKDPKKKTDLFILSCDEGLSDYYRDRYGFEVLTRIDPPAEGGTPELVMYLDTRSATYQQVIAKLQTSAQKVSMTADRHPPAFSSWTGGWGYPDNFYAHSFIERRKAVFEQFEKIKQRLGSSSLPEVEQSGFGSHQPKSVNEISQIASRVQRIGASNILKLVKAETLAAIQEPIKLLSDPWQRFLENQAAASGAYRDQLIIGDERDRLIRILEEHQPLPQIDLQWPQTAKVYDQITLLFPLTANDSSQMLRMLSQSWRHLKHGQALTVMQKFQEPSYGRSSAPQDEMSDLIRRAMKAIQSGLPLTESQIAVFLAQEATQIRQMPEISLDLFMQAAEKAGFIVNHYSLISDESKRTWAITLTKP
jgi:hypothetical protein